MRVVFDTAPIVIREGGGATLLIASLGLALSLGALVWQATTFFLSGPRIRVYLREGLRGPLGIMWAPSSTYTEEGLDSLDRQGYTEEVIGIEAVNRGRLTGTVINWSLRFGNNAAFSNPSDPRNPALPHRLEPFNHATWVAPRVIIEQLQGAFSDQTEEAARVRGEIDLAHRKTEISKNSLIVRH